MNATQCAFLVKITGKVQGVGYRAWTRSQALQLGLTGWVRNEPDGSVTALIAGSSTAITSMLEWFWSGPAGSSVSGVEPRPTILNELPGDFTIAHQLR
ncbi:acylphosphatase [Agrobacterium rhizogenes]|uniref:acylphosphatase n=1 Tax=Rhizobium rhizogenes (strain K84 / ATCC BAA-868) TaxID=311403 RepID=B9JMA7_RHIR8|nr:acylphosphatase [Rhizobium rhizogenes]ACM30858.1 acylphosphatase protein [Rhizobium rhizogenes K84]MDJ1638740.1 acylphosphatase [Rhizobium rhizogenes]NTG77786.1 acylphosphatase [Rhizobium rhizogenes]NTG90500.1 acylphosphatase [Rhizobium rhizogenes]NTH16420.1 acylphosphatase [Rhizobium rhizogenes]